MLNVVAIVGRCVKDPELRTTPTGTEVATVRIACDRNFADKNGQRQADFLDVVAWRNTAKFMASYFQKGSMIAINGSIQTRQYQDKSGNNRTAVEIVADNVSFCGGKGDNSPAQKSSPAASEPDVGYGEPDPGFAEISSEDDLPFN